jgi:beta-lactam-binding protein with PASTA domain
MRLPGSDALRGRLLLALGITLLGVAVAVAAALSAYYTVRSSVAGRDVQVPDLSRMSFEEAQAALKKSGLVLEKAAERNDDRVEAGLILAQDPPAGSVIKPQRKVKVVLSLGDRVSAAPELRGAAARKAQITLQQQGMRLGKEIYVYSRRVEENQVIAQDPLPGTAGHPGGAVDLLVSRGTRPRTFVMPDLAGRRESDAVAFLTRSGLKPAPSRHDPSRPGPRGIVVAQDPESGYPVRAGDLITLTVSGEDAAGG